MRAGRSTCRRPMKALYRLSNWELYSGPTVNDATCATQCRSNEYTGTQQGWAVHPMNGRWARRTLHAWITGPSGLWWQICTSYRTARTSVRHCSAMLR